MIQRQSQNLSLAHRPNAQFAGVGGNFRVELAVETMGDEPVALEPYLERIKHRLDHRCLFEDEPEFRAKPSSLEAIAKLAAGEIFQARLEGARWSSLTVTELDRVACTVTPDFRVSMRIRHRNLTLTLGRAAEWSDVAAHVDRVFARFLAESSENEFIWGRSLFEALKAGIPDLTEALVDLGRHRSLRLADDPSALR